MPDGAVMSEVRLKNVAFLSLLLVALSTCTSDPAPETAPDGPIPRGKADSFHDLRRYEVLLTDPHCDVCGNEDKNHLLASSSIVATVVDLIDNAESTIDVAQFTFSQRPIEEALLRAHERGVRV